MKNLDIIHNFINLQVRKLSKRWARFKFDVAHKIFDEEFFEIQEITKNLTERERYRLLICVTNCFFRDQLLKIPKRPNFPPYCGLLTNVACRQECKAGEIWARDGIEEEKQSNNE